MSMKKTVAAAAIAAGLTVTATGSYASSAPDGTSAQEAAVVKAERQLVNAQRALSTAESSAAADSGDTSKRKCIKKKKVKRAHALMKLKKAKRVFGKPVDVTKSKGQRTLEWNVCTTSYRGGLTLYFEKLKKKWSVSTIFMHW